MPGLLSDTEEPVKRLGGEQERQGFGQKRKVRTSVFRRRKRPALHEAERQKFRRRWPASLFRASCLNQQPLSPCIGEGLSDRQRRMVGQVFHR